MMLFLPALLFLSAILTAQAKKDISDDLKREPLSELLYLFDVTSDAPADDLKAAFRTITLRHSFKVIGERRYIFVAIGTSVEALSQVRFPAGSQVTQILTQHVSEFFKMFGLTTGWEENDTVDKFGNVVITMGQWKFLIPENTPTAVYSAEMAAHAKQFVSTQKRVNSAGYAAVASYPPEIVYIVPFEPNALQYVVKDGLNAAGGPGNHAITMKHLVTI